MLFAANGLIGCPVKASDGEAGTVDDFLFDDRSWLIRWLSVLAGPWLEGRKVLVAPSAMAPIVIPPKPAFPMLSFGEKLTLNLAITRAEIESGPDARGDEAVGHLGGVAALVGFRVQARGRRDRAGRDCPRRRRELVRSLSRCRHARVAARKTGATRAVRRDRDRLERPAGQRERLARAGPLGAGLGPGGLGGRDSARPTPPPLRLAGLTSPLGTASEENSSRAASRLLRGADKRANAARPGLAARCDPE